MCGASKRNPAGHGAGALLSVVHPYDGQQCVNVWEFARSGNAPCVGGEEDGASDEPLHLTFATDSVEELLANWAAHMRRLELQNWLIGATDPDALQALVDSRTPW